MIQEIEIIKNTKNKNEFYFFKIKKKLVISLKIFFQATKILKKSNKYKKAFKSFKSLQKEITVGEENN